MSYTVAKNTKTNNGQQKGIANDEVFKPPRFTRQPASVTVTEGKQIHLRVEAMSSPRPQYRWYHNGKLIQGLAGNSMRLPKARKKDGGHYVCEAYNLAGAVQSRRAMVTVREDKGELRLYIVPESIEVAAQESILMKAEVENVKGDLRFQWYLNDQKIKGATSDFFKISKAKEKYEGRYRVELFQADKKLGTSEASVKLIDPRELEAPSLSEEECSKLLTNNIEADVPELSDWKDLKTQVNPAPDIEISGEPVKPALPVVAETEETKSKEAILKNKTESSEDAFFFIDSDFELEEGELESLEQKTREIKADIAASEKVQEDSQFNIEALSQDAEISFEAEGDFLFFEAADVAHPNVEKTGKQSSGQDSRSSTTEAPVENFLFIEEEGLESEIEFQRLSRKAKVLRSLLLAAQSLKQAAKESA